MNNNIEFACPYCGEVNIVETDINSGKSQSFTQDCEICCRPIEIKVSFNNDGNVSVDVKNDEGF